MTDLLRLATAGSVDDGKSTLVGRLLYDTKSVLADQLDAVHRASVDKGLSTPDLSLLVDGLRSEREQGITIDVAYRYFTTPRRTFVLADTPGHVQYTRNTVTGASTAQLAILLVDARKGVVEQTRRHAAVLALLGVPRLVLAVNKIDLVDYDQETFEVIAKEFGTHAAALGYPDGTVTTIPVSALRGDNVVEPSASTPWYAGPTLLEHLETVPVEPDPHSAPLRFPVQYVIRPRTPEHPDYRGYAGQIAAGSVRPGDEVVVLPAGVRTTVTRIDTPDGELAEATAGPLGHPAAGRRHRHLARGPGGRRGRAAGDHRRAGRDGRLARGQAAAPGRAGAGQARRAYRAGAGRRAAEPVRRAEAVHCRRTGVVGAQRDRSGVAADIGADPGRRLRHARPDRRVPGDRPGRRHHARRGPRRRAAPAADRGLVAPPLVAVAHGSRDPRSAATVAALVDVVRGRAPSLEVAAAFLDLSAPRLPDVLAALHGAGHRDVVVVPLLLGKAFHARVDLPAVVAEATARLPRLSVSVSDVLGPDPRLPDLALRRLRAAGARTDDRSLGVILAGAGSSHPPANAAVSTVATEWARSSGWAGVEAAFASAARPDVPAAAAALRARGARRIAVASWFLAPGRLPDRIAAQAREADPAAVVAEPLGPDPALADLVLDRYAETAAVAASARYA